MTKHYGVDFQDPGWRNDRTGAASEFQSNGAGSGNFAGWSDSHTLADINGSGIGVTMTLSHKPNAWNIEARPALNPYFPSEFGEDGDILRVWNNTSNIGPKEIPSVTLVFTEGISLQRLGLEGYRKDDAFRVQAYDLNGNLVAPNWADPSASATVNPGDPLANVPINLLSTTGTNGATGAEALSVGTYNASDMAFEIRNKDQVFERGASVLRYNLEKPLVSKIVYSMIEVDRNGDPTGEPSDQSMYIGGGIVAKEFAVSVPEPSSILLTGLGALGLMVRRRR